MSESSMTATAEALDLSELELLQNPEPESRLPGGASRPGKNRVVNPDQRERVYFRISKEERERAKYWAERRGFSSVNDYIAEAVSEQIRRENLDYDLPTLEIARLNQLQDLLVAMTTDQQSNFRMMQAWFEAIIGLTRGDNYLLKDDVDSDGPL